MSLRRRTLLTIGITLVGLIIVLFALLQTVLLDSFRDLEQHDTELHAQRVINGIKTELSTLGASTTDYAAWNESYQFIIDANDDYLENNLMDETLINLEVGMILFINADGEIVYSKTLHPETWEEIPFPDALVEKYTTDEHWRFSLPPDAMTGWEGVVLGAEWPMLLAARPILTSNSEGPMRGTLLMGRFISESKVAAFSESLQLDIAAYTIDGASLPDDFLDIQEALTYPNTPVIQALGERTIAGYARIDDIAGTPALIVRSLHERTIYSQGRSSILFLMFITFITGTLFSGLMLWILERTVLSRIAALEADVNAISERGGIGQRITVSGNDELTRLAKNINSMLDSVEKTQKAQYESEIRLQSVIDGAPIMIWATDRDHKFTFFEGTELKQFGINPHSFIGKRAAEMWQQAEPKDLAEIDNRMQRALAGEDTYYILHFSGLTYDTRYTPLRNQDGTIGGVIGVATNITNLQKAEDALHEAYSTLETKNSQLKRVFELFRATLDQMLETVQRGAPSHELMDYLTFVQTQFEKLD